MAHASAQSCAELLTHAAFAVPQEDPNPKRAAQLFAGRQQAVLRAVEDATPGAFGSRAVEGTYPDTASQYAESYSAVEGFLQQHGGGKPQCIAPGSLDRGEEAYPDTDSQFGAPSSAADLPHGALPYGWQCHLDPTHRQPYYVHAPTGRTQWEVPNGASSLVPLPPKRARTQEPPSPPATEQGNTGRAGAAEQDEAPKGALSLLAGYGSDGSSERG